MVVRSCAAVARALGGLAPGAGVASPRMTIRRRAMLSFPLLWPLAPGRVRAQAEPAAGASPEALAAAGPLAVLVRREDWLDPARSRSLPIQLYLPQPVDGQAGRDAAWPLVVYSHGLGGSRDGGRAWGEHWASHGIACLHPQHPGSDATLWRGLAGDRAAVQAALRGGMGPEQLLARVADVRFLIDEVGRRARAGDSGLARVDLARIGIAGHSFGAITTQALMGQRYPAAPGADLAEPRAKAALLFSPSARGNRLDQAFGGVTMPVQCWTGTHDALPQLSPEVSAASRQQVFAHLPTGDKSQIVFDGGDHMLFSGDNLRGRDDPARDQRQWRLIRAGTLAFWRAYLLSDGQARAWLSDAGLGAALAGQGQFSAK